MKRNHFIKIPTKPIGWLVLFFIILFVTGDGLFGQKESGDFIATGEYGGAYWPTHGWRSCAPEAVDMSSEKLRAVYKYSDNPKLNTQGVAIIKDGYIVAEAY